MSWWPGWSWWMWPLMMLAITAVCGALVWLVFLAVPSNRRVAYQRRPEDIVAEHLARGEIDEDEHHRRLDAIHAHPSSGGTEAQSRTSARER